MVSTTWPTGKRVVVRDLAESPEEGVKNGLHFEEQDAPDVSRLGERDVLVGVRSAGVSWVDLLMTSGQYQHMPPLPYIPGLEYSGDVLWAGRVATETLAVGDRVFTDCFNTGPRTKGPYATYGGFASYAVAPLEAVHPIPRGFSYDEACNFAGTYETAYYCLVTRGGLKAGETVLINGATGSTGLAAVQIAHRLGAKVIATGRSLEKLAPLRGQGADVLVSVSNDDGSPGVRRFRDDVKAANGGQGVDVVYDGVGGPVSLESLRCVRFGARFLIVGWASTPLVAKGKGGRGAPNANQLPTNLVLMKGLDVLGSPMIIGTQHDPSLRAPRMAKLLEWASAGELTPYISHVYPLRDAREALLDKWNGKITGGSTVQPPTIW
jgi:NADPH:quinone reductase